MSSLDVNDSGPILDVRDLTVRLLASGDRANAVEDISLSVARGEILCLVGESGSGKSVTAHAAMGLLPRKQLMPSGGKILLQGEDVLQMTPSQIRRIRGRRVAMIFQEPMTALNPMVPCGKQVEEVLRIHTTIGSRQRRQRVMEMFEAVRLPKAGDLYDCYPHQLSGGQRQRIMIAAALILEPALLIADEPTTALDVTTQAQILKLIKQIQRDYATGVLFITHDFGVVAEIADRVVVMERGRVVEQGETHQVLCKPQHAYTRKLISSVPSITPPERSLHTDETVVLSTRALSKIYGHANIWGRSRQAHAARDVAIEIRRNETLGLVGESGSGKSTVARCVARLIDPSDGQIYLNRTSIEALPARSLREHRQRMQIVFQDPYRSLNPRRTVGQSIIEGPMNFGSSRTEARTQACKLMELVGLSPEGFDRFPHQFSGGQRQRIAIARALAMQPDLLIADEAVSALDVSVQAQVLELLDNIKKKFSLAMLFITHDLRVAAQICDRVAVMFKGEIVEYGNARDIFINPQHSYTKSLLNSAPGRSFEFGNFDVTEESGQ